MPLATDPRLLFTARYKAYDRFIRAVRYPQGLRAFFRRSPLLQRDLRILDAGCGTGALTLAVHTACTGRDLKPRVFHAFDLTPAMLERLTARLASRGIRSIELAEANVLDLRALPTGWDHYDLVVSASMLEYVPRDRFVDALASLRGRLRRGGTLVLFMTRRNPMTRLLIGRWWGSNLYTRGELAEAFQQAEFLHVAFRRFPPAAWHLTPWGHVVEARRPE